VPMEDQVRELVRAGRKIEAVKLVRERTGLGLREALQAVEAVEAGGRLPDVKRPRPVDVGDARAQIMSLKAQGQAISAIKLIRQVTGLGLKEAKDMYDAL
jgi:ribosomal protein L7/L12